MTEITLHWMWWLLPLSIIPLFALFYWLLPECPACGEFALKKHPELEDRLRCESCEVEVKKKTGHWRFPMGVWRKSNGQPVEGGQ